MNYQLILASQSPRRKELLSWIRVPFLISPADIDESIFDSERDDPQRFVERLAEMKGSSVIDQTDIQHPFVVASDTTVVLENEILNKPQSIEEARQMLMSLSGRWHTVYTAVALITKDRKSVFSVKTQVEFSEMTPDIVEPYLLSKDSLDKAGAYGIQGMGLTFVKGLQGSYSNVVGFPLVEFIDALREFLGEREHWRQHFNHSE